MGHMKDFDRRIRQGGDEAIAAVSEYVESLRLTDDERAAILASEGWWALESSPHADTLRRLLERTAG